jgi:hypothetical protein
VWTDGQCHVCGLRRQETWVLDDRSRPVMALVWSNNARKPIRAVEFAWMRGTAPALEPRASLAEAVPGVMIGREPACRPDRFR